MSEAAAGQPGFVLRRFEPRHVADGHRLTQDVRWPHRWEDWQFLATLGQGFVAQDGTGSVIGTALWWPWGETAASLGLIIVTDAAQGKGVGRALTGALLTATEGRALTLTATDAGLPLYERLGFLAESVIHQRQGIFTGRPVPVGRPARRDDLAALIALDSAAFGPSRAEAIMRVVEAGETCVIDENGRPVAFAVRRRFGRGEMIGPILARSEDEALALIDALAVPAFVRVDVPADAPRLAAALEARGLAFIDRATTMTRGDWPAARGEARRFGLVSQALG